MLKLTIIEKHRTQDRQDLVHRDVEKITSAVYELFATFYYVKTLTVFVLLLTVTMNCDAPVVNQTQLF